MKTKVNESGLSPIWNWKITALSFVLLFFVGILAISFGPVSLDFEKIIRTLFGASGGLTGQERTLLLDLRLPRALLAALVGAALATSGAVYQTVFRNPLADPYLLGAAAGAGLVRFDG
jgi:iron complex transport system permease protein